MSIQSSSVCTSGNVDHHDDIVGVNRPGMAQYRRRGHPLRFSEHTLAGHIVADGVEVGTAVSLLDTLHKRHYPQMYARTRASPSPTTTPSPTSGSRDHRYPDAMTLTSGVSSLTSSLGRTVSKCGFTVFFIFTMYIMCTLFTIYLSQY